jgi:hypothetical protein
MGQDRTEAQLGACCWRCRGHVQATGGSVPTEAFPPLLAALGFSEEGLQGKRKRADGGSGGGGGGGSKKKSGGGGRGHGEPDAKQARLTSFFQRSSK